MYMKGSKKYRFVLNYYAFFSEARFNRPNAYNLQYIHTD